MNNKELLNRFAALCMELQEEYNKRPQDLRKQRLLEEEFTELKHEILKRME